MPARTSSSMTPKPPPTRRSAQETGHGFQMSKMRKSIKPAASRRRAAAAAPARSTGRRIRPTPRHRDLPGATRPRPSRTPRRRARTRRQRPAHNRTMATRATPATAATPPAIRRFPARPGSGPSRIRSRSSRPDVPAACGAGSRSAASVPHAQLCVHTRPPAAPRACGTSNARDHEKCSQPGRGSSSGRPSPSRTRIPGSGTMRPMRVAPHPLRARVLPSCDAAGSAAVKQSS